MIIISENSTTQLIFIKDDNDINATSTSEDKAMEGVDSGGSEFNKVSIIDINNTKIFRSAKFQDLVQSKEFKARFITPGARLAFIKLRQVFIKVPTLYHFDLKFHIQTKTDLSDYAIDKVLDKLSTDNLS